MSDERSVAGVCFHVPCCYSLRACGLKGHLENVQREVLPITTVHLTAERAGNHGTIEYQAKRNLRDHVVDLSWPKHSLE